MRWVDAFGVLRSPSIGSIMLLGLMLIALFLLWLVVAQVIYLVTLGPQPPASVSSFISDVFTTGAGWALIIVGIGVGFLFALLVLAVSVVSFPLLLDRNVGDWYRGIDVDARRRGESRRHGGCGVLIVAGGLVLGSLPLFVGLVVVLPVLGHATWHLYRKVVPRLTAE